MKTIIVIVLSLMLIPAYSMALQSEVTPDKIPTDLADIWNFEKNSYAEFGPYPGGAEDNVFDIDVYLVNALGDATPWMARLLDGRPLERITDENGREGFRIPAAYSQPSRRLENMWFVDVEILGASPEAHTASTLKAWLNLDDTVINFQQRIYFGQLETFSVTMYMVLAGSSVISETSDHEHVGTGYTTVAVDLNMNSYEMTRTILTARNPFASTGSLGEGEGEGEDQVDAPDYALPEKHQLSWPQQASSKSVQALLLFACLMLFNMEPVVSGGSVNSYIYDCSYSW